MIVMELSNETIVKRRIQDIRHVRLSVKQAQLWSETGKLIKNVNLKKIVCEMSLNSFRDLLEQCENFDAVSSIS